MSFVGCQINRIDVNFYLQKSLHFFDEDSVDNIQSKKEKGINVPSLMPIRVNTNTKYTTNLTIVYPVKMEYGRNFSISDQKVIVKSGLDYFFEIPPRTTHFLFKDEFTSWKGEVLIKSTDSIIKMTWCARDNIDYGISGCGVFKAGIQN